MTHQSELPEEKRPFPAMATDDELIYIGSGVFLSALFKTHPGHCLEISTHFTKSFALNIIKPKE